VFKAALTEHADLYHFHDPELIPVGLLLKLSGKRVIYDVHENVLEDVLSKDYIPHGLRRLVAGMVQIVERLGAALFDGIVAATETIAKRFAKDRAITVQNFPIPAELITVKAIPYARRPLIAAYLGGITPVRGIKEMVQAMAELPLFLPAKLILIGSFTPPELEHATTQLPGWGRVEFMEWQPREKLADTLSRSRVGLVLYHPVPVHVGAQPNKLFEYMSIGIPVIASNFPLWREIIEECKCGIVVDPLNPKEIANAMLWLFDHPTEAEAMGIRGMEAVNSRYNWSHESKKLVSLYQTLCPTVSH
jgi:glycosyltransferase involved in cell wall biosynthesis